MNVRDVEPAGLPERPDASRTLKFAVLGFNAALLMAPFSVLLSVATYAPETERDALALAPRLALGSILLVGAFWSRLPKFVRVWAAETLNETAPR